MKSKEQLIEEFLKTPFKKGEYIEVQGLSSRNPEKWEWATLVSLPDANGDMILEKEWQKDIKRNISEVRRVTDFVGVDPFKKTVRVTGYLIDIYQLLLRSGYAYNSKSETEEETLMLKSEEPGSRDKGAPDVCFDPIVVNEKGEEVEYQRGLVWSEQQKQLLIMSIWNNIEIGKFVFRLRKYDWVMKRMKAGKIKGTAFADLVDGKQRVNAIVSYIKGDFADLNGVYFKDLSESAKRRFMNYNSLSYIELPTETTDAETLQTFLAINFAGVPMSMEHIQFVQSIKIK